MESTPQLYLTQLLVNLPMWPINDRGYATSFLIPALLTLPSALPTLPAKF